MIRDMARGAVGRARDTIERRGWGGAVGAAGGGGTCAMGSTQVDACVPGQRRLLHGARAGCALLLANHAARGSSRSSPCPRTRGDWRSFAGCLAGGDWLRSAMGAALFILCLACDWSAWPEERVPAVFPAARPSFTTLFVLAVAVARLLSGWLPCGRCRARGAQLAISAARRGWRRWSKYSGCML